MSDFIYKPPRATSITLQEVKRRASSPYHLDFGIPAVDNRIIPPVPGDTIGILGRPGHAKTTTMIALSKRWSKLVRAKKDSMGRSPLTVYATWETSVEEFMAVYTAAESGQSLESIGRGTADIGRIENALVGALGNNVIVVGHSRSEVGEGRTSKDYQPRVGDLDLALRSLREEGFEIAALFVDYLQKIPHHKYDDSQVTARVNDNLEWLKSIALSHKTCVVMGVQADRRVDSYAGLKLPLDYDAQHTSRIEQDCDKLWSITLPARYLDPGKVVEVNGWNYSITPSTLAFRSIKQRFGPNDASDVWLLDLNLAKAELREHATLGEAEPFV